MEGKDDSRTHDSIFGLSEAEISRIFNEDGVPVSADQTKIVIFTEYQESLVSRLREALKLHAPDRLAALNSRLEDMTRLAHAIGHFPSLLGRENTVTSVRTPASLVESIISYQDDGDTTLHMPAKAALGKAFLITKMHTFFSMYRLASRLALMDDASARAYYNETVSMMFVLMAEDVYMNLIKDSTIDGDLRRQLAAQLIILWEHRNDEAISDIAPVLQAVWTARRTLAPVFGTMMGASELLALTVRMDWQWSAFLKARLAVPDVSQSLEEFLFGLSYEQINRLKSILREQGVKSIGRDQVSTYLGESVKTDMNLDYRDFYLLYTVRRDNARARRRLHLDGPKNTLEDHFILYVLEKQNDALSGDVLAKA